MAHISDEVLQAYAGGKLSVQAESEVLLHIAECDRCAGRFADLLMTENPVSPPPDLRESILGRTVYRNNPLGAIGGILASGREKQREFLVYCARVVFAVTVSLLMVFSVSPGQYSGHRQLSAVQTQQEGESRRGSVSRSLREASGKFGDALNDFLTLFDRAEEEGK